jgi:hypothetical protein
MAQGGAVNYGERGRVQASSGVAVAESDLGVCLERPPVGLLTADGEGRVLACYEVDRRLVVHRLHEHLLDVPRKSSGSIPVAPRRTLLTGARLSCGAYMVKL